MVKGKGVINQSHVLVYRFSPLADDSSRSEGGNLDVSLQLHLFLGSEEVLFLQLAEDATLSLQPDTLEYRLLMLHLGNLNLYSRIEEKNKTEQKNIFLVQL